METNSTPDISVVIPIYNEQETIEILYAKLEQSLQKGLGLYEIVFINDGSTDQSLSQIQTIASKNKTVKYISFTRNFGHQVALTAGLEHAGGKAIVIMDGDLQDPPELIPALYGKYKEGFKVVYAKRKKRNGETFFKKTTALFFYRLLRYITNIEIPLDVGDFRLIDKEVAQHLIQMGEQNKFYRGQIAWLGFKHSFVEFERDERYAGNSGYDLRKMVRLALDGVTAFSDSPLKIATRLGITVSIFAFLMVIYALYSHFLLQKTVTGWTSLMISSMLIGGIQLFCIGIIGEYLSRINKDIKKRPLYIIDKTSFE